MSEPISEEYFIVFDASGSLVGRYLKSIHGNAVPDNAVEVDRSLFEATIADTNGQWRLNVDGTITKHAPPPNSLEDDKAIQAAVVSSAFEMALLAGHMTSLNIKMDATLEALQKLKTGYDFAVLVGNTKMSVVDYGNAAHADMPLADVEKIMKEVGGNYQAMYLKKQMLRGQVMAATTAEQVAAVVW